MAMSHSVQDGIDAARRARTRDTAKWHPLLAAHEDTPGHWWMIDDLDAPYGEIRMVRRGGEVGYRADFVRGDHRAVVGYYRTLRAATWNVHAKFLRAHGAREFMGYGR